MLEIPQEYRGLMIFRMFIGYFGVQGIWASNKYMPISMAMCIIMTMPVWVALIAHFYLDEKMNKLQIVAVFTSMLGVFIINKPHE